MSGMLRRAEPALVPLLILVGAVQASQRHGADRWVSIVWVVALALPLLARHRWPASASIALVLAGVTVQSTIAHRSPFVAVVLAVLIGFYSAGAWAARLPAYAALVVGLAAFWTDDVRLGHPAGEYVASALLVAGPWAAGRALRAVRAQNARLLTLTRELEDERERRARDAVLAERARIAREMHDVVGHSLSVISLHSQAATGMLGCDPERVREPLAAIERATHAAMGEMRRLVAVLANNEADAATSTAPLPAVRDLSTLVAEHRASGLDVRYDLAEPPATVPAGVELAAYRIVQESLTNVRRHTMATAVRVGVHFGPGCAEVDVADDGPAAPGNQRGGGYGLVGARARAVSCGGWVEAGPDGPGWRVHARLPYDASPVA